MPKPLIEVSYFPGCSLATSARESNQSLVRACEILGLRLTEIEDWNCCGTSSAHSLDKELGLGLVARNLALAPPDKPLLTMCPSCFRNLLGTHHHLVEDPAARRTEERRWGAEISPDLKIISFLELLHFLDRMRGMGTLPELEIIRNLRGLKVAPYYGCMAMFPPSLRRTHVPFDLMSRQLKQLGAEILTWGGAHRCCGTFLAAAKPDITGPLVNQIVQSALDVQADCLVTACAMCQLNLEIRCSLPNQIPVLHFTELMALVLGATDYERWFARHLIDPKPLLRQKNLIG